MLIDVSWTSRICNAGGDDMNLLYMSKNKSWKHWWGWRFKRGERCLTATMRAALTAELGQNYRDGNLGRYWKVEGLRLDSKTQQCAKWMQGYLMEIWGVQGILMFSLWSVPTWQYLDTRWIMIPCVFHLSQKEPAWAPAPKYRHIGEAWNHGWSAVHF